MNEKTVKPVVEEKPKEAVVEEPIPDGTKSLVFTKSTGQRWQIGFNGKITQRDINHLKRFLAVEFARERRRKSRQRKEQSNGSHPA